MYSSNAFDNAPVYSARVKSARVVQYDVTSNIELRTGTRGRADMEPSKPLKGVHLSVAGWTDWARWFFFFSRTGEYVISDGKAQPPVAYLWLRRLLPSNYELCRR